MAISDEEKIRLQEAEADLKNQTVFFPIIAGFLGFLVVISVYFYHVVEKWEVLDSLYFVVVTMATVGYGDYTPTNNIAKLYTIFLILIGIATFTTFVTQVLKRQGLKQVQRQLQGKPSRLKKGVKDLEKKL